MPCTAVAASGMCISGFSLRVFTIRSPSGMILIMDISTMRSCAVSTPVVSKSKKTIGRLSFNSIFVRSSFRYAFIIMGMSSISTDVVRLSSYTGLKTPARVESASSTDTVGVSMFESISTRNVDLKPMVTGCPS